VRSEERVKPSVSSEELGVRSEEPKTKKEVDSSEEKNLNAQRSTLNASLSELPKVVEAMQRLIPDNAVISLRGDLAAGKTTLVQAIARSLDNESAVTSPTFSLQHSYSDSLHHYDLYRKSFEELAALGIVEEFEKPGWHLVEWADEQLKAFLDAAGYNLWEVTITPRGDRRIYHIEPLNA